MDENCSNIFIDKVYLLGIFNFEDFIKQRQNPHIIILKNYSKIQLQPEKKTSF